MVAAAKKAGKLLLIAQVLPFFPEYKFVLAAVKSGKYGKLLGGHFKRVIADPKWIEDFHDPRGAGGAVVDLHIHDAHFIRLLCGQPQAVFSTGRQRGEVVEFVNTQFLFSDPGLSITAQSGVIRQQGRPFTHAFELYLEKATLTYDLAGVGDPPVGTPLTLIDAKGGATSVALEPVDAFVAELTEAVKAVKTGRPSPLLAGDLALDALTLCHREQQSVRQRRTVKV
jgi:predicted dehydrogenase